MSVLIRDMEMPTSCGDCPFKCWTMQGDECMFGVADMTYQGRPKDCPLVPVTEPHGDLIDRDDFFAACPELVDGYKRITDDLILIPAEEGE